MAAFQAELKSWTANRIGDLTQTRDSDCLEIAECILENEDLADPEALKAWLSPFVTEESAKHKADSFVEALFERKAQIALLQSNPQGAAGGEGAKGKSKEGKGGPKGGRGRDRDEDRGKGKSGKGEKQRVLPTMDMPFLPRREGDKRLMVVDASSGRHNVLTNCLNCGKVITEQEGWGPCLFCGNPLEVGDRRTGIKRGDERGRIEVDGRPAGDDDERYNASFQRAVATKDRLLSYDRDAKRRTKVYDDATDWYSEAANPWLSEKQREEAKAKGQDEERRRREERRKIHATIDIFGRTVIDTSADVEANMKKKDRETFQEWTEGTTKNQRLLKMLEEQRGIGGANAQMSDESQKLYERLRAALHAAGTGKDKGYESLKATKAQDGGMEGRKTRSWNVSGGDRVEDEFSAVTLRDFQGSERPLLPAEESPYGDAEDAGQCLSMHQPWASLLVYGFKRAEGRSWSTDHRGRLWIHATSKAPDPDEVAALEERYRDIYESAGVPIPPLPSKSGGYPTSALLGCVDLEACWTQVEYASVLARNPSMPQEESQSEHVFWCLRPRRLLVPLKMGGDHKIWKLEKSALTPAQRGLQPVRWPVPEEGESNIVSPALA